MSLFKKRDNNKQLEINNQREMIEVFDEFGRKMIISRKDWLDSVLPGQLERHWNEPDALYQDIVLAVQDGFISEVLDASKRLFDIDPIKERCYTILAIVYMKLNYLKEADNLLLEYIKRYGKTGTILTNLAKVYSAKNEDEKSQDILWESICIDPNQDNGFAWWAAIQREKYGPEEYIKSIEKACEIKGSWLPQLHLARYYLEIKDLEKAKKLYQDIMPFTKERPEILYMISGDLGNSGYIGEVIDLLAPIYDVEHHDARIGLNLLQAYLSAGNYEDGQRLLNQLMQLNRYDLREHLMEMSNKFEDIRIAKIDAMKNQAESPDIITVGIDKPIWYYGLNSPDWLLPKRERNKKVCILPFADITQGKNANDLGRENHSGMISRGIPLFITELLVFCSDLEPSTLIPVASGIGVAISNKEYELNDIKETASRMQVDYIVSGSINASSSEYTFRITIYDRILDTSSIKEFKCAFDTFGTSFYKMINELTEILPFESDYQSKKVLSYYQTPKPEYIYGYLLSLDQSFDQTITENEYCSIETLWGERNIINSYMQLSLVEPDNEVMRILLISGLAKCKSYGSEKYKEFKEQAFTLLNKGVFARNLLPIAYKTFNTEDKEASIETKDIKVEVIDAKEYDEWLARIDQ